MSLCKKNLTSPNDYDNCLQQYTEDTQGFIEASTILNTKEDTWINFDCNMNKSSDDIRDFATMNGNQRLNYKDLNKYVFVNTKEYELWDSSDTAYIASSIHTSQASNCNQEAKERGWNIYSSWEEDSFTKCCKIRHNPQIVLIKSYTLASLPAGSTVIDPLSLTVITGYDGSISVKPQACVGGYKPCPDQWAARGLWHRIAATGPRQWQWKSTCNAPASYTGSCNHVSTFDGYSDAKKRNWATGCDANWSCKDSLYDLSLSVQMGVGKSNACEKAPKFDNWRAAYVDYSDYCPVHWYRTHDQHHCKATWAADYDGHCGDSHMNMNKKHATNAYGRRRLERNCDLHWPRVPKKRLPGTDDEWSNCHSMKIILDNRGKLMLYKDTEPIGEYGIPDKPGINMSDRSKPGVFDIGQTYLPLYSLDKDNKQPVEWPVRRRHLLRRADENGIELARFVESGPPAILYSPDGRFGMFFEYNSNMKNIELNIYCVPEPLPPGYKKYAINSYNLGKLGYISADPSPGDTSIPTNIKFYDLDNLNIPGRLEPDDTNFIEIPNCQIEQLPSSQNSSLPCKKICSGINSCIGYSKVDGQNCTYYKTNSRVDTSIIYNTILGPDFQRYHPNSTCGYRTPKIRTVPKTGLPNSCITHIAHERCGDISQNDIKFIDTAYWSALNKYFTNSGSNLPGCGEHNYIKQAWATVRNLRDKLKVEFSGLLTRDNDFECPSPLQPDCNPRPRQSAFSKKESFISSYKRIDKPLNPFPNIKYIIYLLTLIIVIIVIIILIFAYIRRI